MPIQSIDTFIRANQTAWGTASDGETWAQVRGGMTWAITSNKGTCNSAGGTFNVFQIGSKTASATEIIARVVPADTTSNTGLIARYGSSTAFYYGVLNAGNLVVGKNNSGFSTISSGAFAYSAGTAYLLKFRLVGTSLLLTAWADGSAQSNSWIVNTTDSTFSSGGYGCGCDSSSATNTQYDMLTVTDTHRLICDGMGGVFS